MACFPFRRRQPDHRLNMHSVDETSAIRPVLVSQPAQMSQINRPRTSSGNGSNSILRSTSNGSKQSPSRKRSTPVIVSTPERPGKEVRPTGLFADMKPALMVQASSPIKHTYHSERRGNMSLPQRQDIDRGRRRGPSGGAKADKVLGREPDLNTRRGNLSPTITSATASSESLRSRAAVGMPSPPMVNDTFPKQRRSRTPKPVELPGSYHDVMEKQIVAAPASIVSTNSHSSSRSRRNDSAAELTIHVKSDGSIPIPVELPAEEVVVQAFELPGSDPYVAECDAGPPPPTELPGSYGFMDEKLEMKLEKEEILLPHTYVAERPSYHELPAGISH